MEITTKFNIGDIVWVIREKYEHKLTKGRISSVTTSIGATEDIHYIVNNSRYKEKDLLNRKEAIAHFGLFITDTMMNLFGEKEEL